MMNKLCSVNGCRNHFPIDPYARRKPSRCPEHRSGWSAKPPARDLAYIDPVYKANRKIVPEQEPTCHWRIPGVCTGRSTTADHLTAISRGGTNDLGNLVGACEPCNRRRGVDLGNQTKRLAAARRKRG